MPQKDLANIKIAWDWCSCTDCCKSTNRNCSPSIGVYLQLTQKTTTPRNLYHNTWADRKWCPWYVTHWFVGTKLLPIETENSWNQCKTECWSEKQNITFYNTQRQPAQTHSHNHLVQSSFLGCISRCINGALKTAPFGGFGDRFYCFCKGWYA